MSETQTYTLNGMHHDGSGVERQVPFEPIRTTRTLLPLSWFRHEIEVTLVDGDSLTGTLLDLCPCGPILRVRLSKSEACRRVVSWDSVRFVDLIEGQ